MSANSVQSDMLRDIEREVAYTRHEIGRDAFAPRVMAAMAAVPREQFVPESGRHLAFANGPLAIGHGQTISQPYIVALMTDLLAPRPQDCILEIGTGSGYQAAVLAELVRQVYSVEIIAALATAAGQRLAATRLRQCQRQACGRLPWLAGACPLRRDRRHRRGAAGSAAAGRTTEARGATGDSGRPARQRAGTEGRRETRGWHHRNPQHPARCLRAADARASGQRPRLIAGRNAQPADQSSRGNCHAARP